MRRGFQSYVRQLERYIEEKKPVFMTLQEIVEVLNISPNYAREIAKTVAARNGWVYRRAILFIKVTRTEAKTNE